MPVTISFTDLRRLELQTRPDWSRILLLWTCVLLLTACCHRADPTTPKTVYYRSINPSCDMPQEPSPIHIVPYASKDFIIISRTDWAALGGYIYAAQSWIRSAGPCLKSNGSDVPAPSNGVMTP